MAQVVSQADAFDQVFVSSQGACQRTANLSDLQGMCQARAIIITFIVDKNLGLIFQAPECGCVQNTVAVALETGAVIAGSSSA
jgi:hypothetical protein